MPFPSNIRLPSGRVAPISRKSGLIRKKGIMGRAISYSRHARQWQVWLDKGMGRKDKVETLVHETAHLLDHDKRLGLSERQVEGFAPGLVYALRHPPGRRAEALKLVGKRLGLSARQVSGLRGGFGTVLRKNPKYRGTIKAFVRTQHGAG